MFTLLLDHSIEISKETPSQDIRIARGPLPSCVVSYLGQWGEGVETYGGYQPQTKRDLLLAL